MTSAPAPHQPSDRTEARAGHPATRLDAPLLELDGLSKVFRAGRSGRPVHAVNDVSLTVRRGEVLGLVGESGSGKSTIARLIARLHRPSAGIMRLDGAEVPLAPRGRAIRRLRRRVQMIFQDPYSSLNPLHPVSYTVGRPLTNFGLARGREKRERVVDLLERVGLAPGSAFLDKLPHELSGGQRQRVGIARALAASPDLLLADEPTSMLDVSIRLDVMNLLLDLRDQEGLSLLFITHDLAGARYMSDRIAVLYAGHVVEIGPARDVIESSKHPYTELLKAAAPKPELGLGVQRIEARGEVPDLSQRAEGCPFAARCPHVRDVCRQALPRMVSVAEDHQVRCVLHDPAIPQA